VNSLIIIGRPNVGKSTLFNCLLRERRVLVHNQPGVTRDWIEACTNWNVQEKDYAVRLIDTAGIDLSFSQWEQLKTILQAAQAILIVVDGKSGLTGQDQQFIQILKKKNLLPSRGVFLGVNKIDIEKMEAQVFEFYSLGIQSVLGFSAEHGRGIESLKKQIVSEFAVGGRLQPSFPNIAIVGKPNTGKSTLLNTLLGKNRLMTSPNPGTTIDSVDVNIRLNSHWFTLIDTAGIRRRSRTQKGIETLSIIQTQKSLQRSDLAVLVLDGEKGTSEQDEKIAGMIEKAGCAVVILVNKWDTQKKTSRLIQLEAEKNIRREFKFLSYASILFVSALQKQGLKSLGTVFQKILTQRAQRISTHLLTEKIRHHCVHHSPKDIKVYLCQQVSIQPPTFICHVNQVKKVHFSFHRYLINLIRKSWGYEGSLIRLFFRSGNARKNFKS